MKYGNFEERDEVLALGMTKRHLVLFSSAIVFAFLALGAFIIAAVYVEDTDSTTATFKRVKDDAIVQVLQEFDDAQTWRVPDTLSNDGRAFVTMSGGGGGGCSGSSVHAGGGGNSGVSAVHYPVVIRKNDMCRVRVGDGGAPNNDGAETSIICTAKDAKNHVKLTVDGGQSGCTFFNGTQTRRGGSGSYPVVPERVGGRPSTGYAAESHPYGGAAGDHSSGGAGSVFGDGADGATAQFATGDSADEYGAGGGGGGTSGGVGGYGKRGRVVLVYYADVLNN